MQMGPLWAIVMAIHSGLKQMGVLRASNWADQRVVGMVCLMVGW
jgi:hypothetical protein